MICMKCGLTNPDNSVFCCGCGASLQEPPAVAEKVEAAPKKKKKAGLIVSIILVAVILAGAVTGYILWRNSPRGIIAQYASVMGRYNGFSLRVEAEEYDLGDDVKVSHRILSSRKLSKDELKELEEYYDDRIEYYEDNEDLKVDFEIQDAREYWVDLTLKGSEGECSKRSRLTLIKVDGVWYID